MEYLAHNASFHSLVKNAPPHSGIKHLDISPRTVEIHRANMMTKLGAGHAAEAVRLWMDAQLGGQATSMPTGATLVLQPQTAVPISIAHVQTAARAHMPSASLLRCA